MFVIFFIKVAAHSVLGQESRYAEGFFIYLFLSFVLRISHSYTKKWTLWYKSSLAQLVRRWTSDPEVGVQVRIAFRVFLRTFFHLLIFFQLNKIIHKLTWIGVRWQWVFGSYIAK